jgi:hypothetical protein
MAGRNPQTQAKRARELALKEKRERKREKKAERAAAAAAAEADPTSASTEEPADDHGLDVDRTVSDQSDES